MPLRLKPAVEQLFYLERTDEEYPPETTNEAEPQKTYVVIRQASQAQHERRSDLFSQMTSKLSDPGIVEIIQRFSYPELQRIEVFLTLKETNIEDEDGTPLFKFKEGKITEAEFNRAWGKLPPLVANEIHSKVLELNPTWGKLGEVS